MMATIQRSLPVRTRPFGFSRLLGHPLIYLILLLGIVVTLLPFGFAILSSFKTNTEIVRIPPTFWPEKWTFQNYLTIFNDPKV
ncbi:MAG: carbohydrate ABC transporter permease, partial [Chloroflexota bacterium]